jgi:hypothetical protein
MSYRSYTYLSYLSDKSYFATSSASHRDSGG